MSTAPTQTATNCASCDTIMETGQRMRLSRCCGWVCIACATTTCTETVTERRIGFEGRTNPNYSPDLTEAA